MFFLPLRGGGFLTPCTFIIPLKKHSAISACVQHDAAGACGRSMDLPSRNELIPNPAVRRLSLYLRQLESFKRKDRRTISSKQLGESLGLTDAQVRKDFAYFGQFGHPGIGYRVDDLIAQVKRILGTDKTWNVILVGAGNLGRALLAYRGFDQKGFRLTAVFDADAGKIGKRQASFTIQGLSELAATVREKNIR